MDVKPSLTLIIWIFYFRMIHIFMKSKGGQLFYFLGSLSQPLTNPLKIGSNPIKREGRGSSPPYFGIL